MPQLISNASHVHGINAKYTHCPLNRRFNDIYYYEYKNRLGIYLSGKTH